MGGCLRFHCRGLLRGDRPLGDEFARKKFPRGWMRFYRFVHPWLGIGGFVLLVVPEAAISDEIDNDVAAEFCGGIHNQVHRRNAAVDIVRVDVHDWNVESFAKSDAYRVERLSRTSGSKSNLDCWR